ncbi:MAG: iron-sulfur cluster assembly accessory protein [Gammaproteobacteria bacterium]|jgi:iron-sulfur cluster assembly protein
MITVTQEAAKQIRESARQGNAEGLPLRIAAQRQGNGSIHYAMGFADEEHDEDLHFNTEGVEIIVSPVSLGLLDNTIIDFVELDGGEKNFIFKNPNDPNFQPPGN